MTLDLSSDTWARIRHDYEFTDRPVEDICAEHGISAGTLRNRMRRWNWTRRRAPIPAEGPLPAPSLYPSSSTCPEGIEEDASAATLPPAAPESETASSSLPAAGEGDPAAIVPRLQTAIVRLLPAIEATVAALGAQPVHPREMERAARVLAALTRTLRELNTLLRQCPAPAPGRGDDDVPEDIEEFREQLLRRIQALAAEDAAAQAAAAAAADVDGCRR